MFNYLKICVFCLFSIYIIILIISMSKKKTFYELTNKQDFDIDFNENKFLPIKNIDRYWYLVNKGYERMKQTDIVIGGLFMNSSGIFDKFKARIENMSNLFKSLKCVFFENDSTDNSRILLLDWEEQNPNIHIIKCEENNYCLLKSSKAIKDGQFSETRMIKMAKYRNILLNYIKKNFTHTPFVGFIDTDIKGGISFDGIAHSFGIEPELKWDMCSAFGMTGLILTLNRLIYYDFIALKTSDYAPNKVNNMNYIEAIKLYFKYIHNLKRGDEPVLVQSAFCGFALYKMDSIRNSDYTPIDNNYLCEHIIFHDNMIRNGFDKIYINPNMLLFAGKQGSNTIPFYY
jgi:hypothetical protein